MRSTMQLGNATSASIQAASSGIARPREIQDAARDHRAIVLEIVAGEHGERAGAGSPPARQSLGDEAEHGARCAGMGEIVTDVRRVEPEPAGRLVEIVAALGDGQRDDADGRIAQPAQHGLGIGRGEQVLDDGADDRGRGLALGREQE